MNIGDIVKIIESHSKRRYTYNKEYGFTHFSSNQLMPISKEEIQKLQKILIFS